MDGESDSAEVYANAAGVETSAYPSGTRDIYLWWSFCGMTEEPGEKEPNSFAYPRKHTSGPKGRVDLARLIPGMNPRPTARTNFAGSEPRRTSPFAQDDGYL